MSGDLLTAKQVEKITGGAVQSKIQSRYLKMANIHHWYGHDGKIKTTWYHVNHPIIAPVETMPLGHLDPQIPQFGHLKKVAG